MKTDQEIITAILHGDRASYSLLVERYQAMVRAVTIGVLRDPDQADDAAQEAFISAFEKLARLRSRSAFAPWIARIAKREAYRQIRRSRRAQPLNPQDETAAVSQDTELMDLLSVVSRLPDRERQTVQLKHFSGWSSEEIAEMTGHPIGTITKRLSRAYRRMRRWMECES